MTAALVLWELGGKSADQDMQTHPQGWVRLLKCSRANYTNDVAIFVISNIIH